MILVDFADPREPGRWSAVDDVVMGGRSQSRILFDPAGHAVFSGRVSRENSGGFASVRRAPDDLGVAGAVAYLLEVLGDGRRYKFSARIAPAFDAPAYQCAFHPPAGTWATCRLESRSFVPTWRGRAQSGHPPLDPAQVRQIGFVIGDGQDGEFSLAVRSVHVELPAA